MNRVDVGLQEIMKILPHRDPFLFVDRVLELQVDEQVLAQRVLREDEPHFPGHFPGRAIMPGVLITEALAQTSGLLLALSAMERGERPQGDIFYLARADMKWTEPVAPGETLLLEARLQRNLGPLTAFKVRAFTRKKDVASGNLTLARVEG